MRRQPRPPVSLGRRAISSRRNRNRTQHHSVHRNQIQTRTRSSSSRSVAAQQRSSASPSARFYSALSSLIESAAKESRDTVIMASQSFAVPWHRIKLWVEAQEKAEQQGQTPSMTKIQLAALSQLVNFVEAEPDIGGLDYVSLLIQHIQYQNKKSNTNALALPTYQDVGLEIPINGNFNMRWRTTCSLSSVSHMVFPCEGHGISRGQQPPLFATKKASKQYAAKHALAYLKAEKSPPADTTTPVPAPAPAPTTAPAPPPNPVSGGVSLKPATPPVLTSPKASDNSVNTGSSSLAMPPGDAGGAILVSPPPASGGVTATDESLAEPAGSITPDAELYNGEGPSILKQVADEAKRLNFGCPTYKVVPDLEKPGCWIGTVTFQNGGRIPDNIADITGASSKGAAKMLMAEKLYEYFKTELDRRHEVINSFDPEPTEPKEP